MAETTCPVFRPTEKEFAHFRRYMEEVIDPQARKAGLCKVIPPPGWAAKRRVATEELCKSVYIPAPIRQCVSSTRSNGVYSVDVVENRPMSLTDFKAYADKRAPFPSSTANAGFPGCPAGVRRGRSSGLSTHEGRRRDSVGGEDASGENGGGGGGARGAPGQESEVARRVRMFWRSLGPNSEAPLYGADTLGTLFAEDDDDAWNVGRLDTILQLLKANLPGITTSMLYAGMWRSMFAFHVEDVNLYSINYLHRGDPKSWYGIPPDSRQRFESLAQAFFTEEFRACKDHLRHKTSMISPLQIQKAGIGFCTAVQEAGEFMITFPSAYHGGFNHGFNLAESTNFAIDRWIEEGRGAGYCRCSPHSVRIDVDRFETLVRQHRRIAGHAASCLDGLAEAPPPPRDTPRRDSPGKGRSKKRQTPPMPSAADCEAEGREDDGDDEDIQVFQCVCSTVRVLRRVRRTATGECVPIAPPSFSGTASHNGSSSSSNGRASHPAGGGSGGAGMNGAGRGWPEEKLSACPRCGVWGHTTCLEFDATAFLTKGVKGASGATGGVRKRGREGGKSSPAATPAAVPAEMAVGGTMDLSDVAGAGEGGDVQGAEISGFRTISATYDASWAYVDADVDTNAGPAAGQEVEEDGAAAAAPVIVVPVARPSPICWMCMQEKASSAAASLAVATGGGDGGASGGTAAPRREGKASGDSPNYGEGGGGGSGTSGAAIVRGGGVAKRARKTGVSLSLDAAQSNGSSGIDFVGGDPNAAGNRNDGGGVVDTVGMAAAVDPAIAVLHKRARVGPRLIGREVLVSDGVAAVLSGVVSAIEAGQARIHYKGGRKAKLDEWIDVRSERFLSVAEAKKQMELARLAMNTTPAAAVDPTAPGKQGKKRKVDGRSSAIGNAKAGEDCGGRAKKKLKRANEEGGKAISAGKLKNGKGKGKARDDTGREKEKGNKAVGNAGRSSAKSAKVLSKVGGKRGKGDDKGTGSRSNAANQSPNSKEKRPKMKSAEDAKSPKTKDPKVKFAKVNTPIVKLSAKAVSPREESKCSMQKESSAVGKGKGKGSKGIRKTPETGKKVVGKGVSNLAKGAGPKPGKVGVGVGKSGSQLSKDKISSGSGSSRGSKAGKNVARDQSTTVSQGKLSAKKTKPPSISNKKGTASSKGTPATNKTEKGTVNADQATTAGDGGSKGWEKSSKKAKKPTKEVDEGVAAGLRQAIARLARLPPELDGGSSTYSGPASAPTVSEATTLPSTAATSNTALAAAPNISKEKTAATKRDWRTAEYGFAGASWGLGPFFRGARRRPFASSASQEPLPPPNRAGNGTSDGTIDVDEVAVVHDEERDWEQDEEREAERMAKHFDLGWRFKTDRANVRHGETVDLGDDLAYREWLLRLRKVQDIPIGHVERCAHQLAILLGSAPADGAVRASLRALLVAECLRGGASAEVAAHVRRLVSLIADAASRARPLPKPSPLQPQSSPAPSPQATVFAPGEIQGQRLPVPMNGGVVGWESRTKSRISGVASGLTAARAHSDTIPGMAEGHVEVAGGKDGRGDCAHARGSVEDGDAPPPPQLMNLIRDSESAAAYTHALVHIARSKSKQTEAARTATDAENQDTARLVVVGKLPGAFPCSSSGDSSALHAKAMVGLRRTQRWAEAWLALPWGSSSRGQTVSEPLPAATVTETARKTLTPEGSSSESIVGEVRAADDTHGVARPESSEERRRGVDAAEAQRKVVIAPPLAALWTDGKPVVVFTQKETGGHAAEQERVARVTAAGDHSAKPQPAAARSETERVHLANTGEDSSRLEEADRQPPPPSPVQQVSGSHINSDAATNITATTSAIDKASAEYQAGFAAAIGEPDDKRPVGGYSLGTNGPSVRTPYLWPPSVAAPSVLGFNLAFHPSMACQQMSNQAAHSAAVQIAAQHAAAAAAAAATVTSSGGGRTTPFGWFHPFWTEAAGAAKVNAEAGQTNGAAIARTPSPSGGESARTRGVPALVAMSPALKKPVAATRDDAAAAAASVGMQQFSGHCAVPVPSSLVGDSGAFGAHVLASPAVALPAAGVAATSGTPAAMVSTSMAVVGGTSVGRQEQQSACSKTLARKRV